MNPNIDAHTINGDPVRLKPQHLDEIVGVLTRAFIDDPLLRYVCQEDDQRFQRTKHIIRSVVLYGSLYGEVWVTPGDITGAMVWMPPHTDNMTFVRQIRTGMIFDRIKLGKAGSDRYNLFNSIVNDLHHSLMNQDHWYLFVLGVEPDHHGRGTGTKLMNYMLKRIDQDGLPVYLTTTHDGVIPFYKRLGFNVEGNTRVPESGLELSGLIRPAFVK
jgi:ribosomal protein S18 acetylase RimI-like enzyme